MPHGLFMDTSSLHIYSVDTLLYSYALPILQTPYPFSSLCLSCNLSSSLRSLHLYPYQSHSTAILSELCRFFNKSQDNSIEFWECSSHLRWRLHKDVDKDSKSFNPTPSFPCKISWDYCRKSDCDDIIKHQMEKENNSLTYLMTTLTLSNWFIPKVNLGFKSSVTSIHYALVQQEPLPITPLLENTI